MSNVSRETNEQSTASHLSGVVQVDRGDLRGVFTTRPYQPHGLKSTPSRVLEEDDYVTCLQTIIERDFFPDLAKLRQEKDLFLGNRCKVEAQQQLVRLMDGRELLVDLEQLSLDQFQSLFTSEDNASFEQLVEAEKAKLSAEQLWIESAALRHNRLNQETELALEAGERPNRLVYSNLPARNAFMFPLTDGNVGVMELHPASSGGVVALCVGSFPRDAVPSDSLVSRPGVTVTSNTRLGGSDAVGSDLLESLRREQVARHEALGVRAKEEALFDKMLVYGKYSAAFIERQRQLAANRRRPHRLETPALTPDHHGYRFLHTPRLDPGVSVTPLMSWGHIAATPLLLSKPEDRSGEDRSSEPARFQIPEMSPKEQAAQRLQEQAKRPRKSTGLRHVLNTPLLRSNSVSIFNTPGLHGTRRQLNARKVNVKTPNVRIPVKPPTSSGTAGPPVPQESRDQAARNKRQKIDEKTYITDGLLEF